MNNPKRGARVLLIGCGDLGSRHLQAVVKLPQVRELDVVDPNPAALQLGCERLAEVPLSHPAPMIRWLASLDDARSGGELCIVATLADVRCQLVRSAAQTLGYRTFLLEKIVAPSVEEYESLIVFAAAHGLSVWVNCQNRAHPIQQRAKRHLMPGEPIVMHVAGGNFGLATNGIHAVDLFAFYDEARRIEVCHASVDPILHPSKRGPKLFDLSGTLHGVSDRGSQLLLSYGGDHRDYQHVMLSSRHYRMLIDHYQRWAMESDASSGWAWRPVPYEGSLLTSQTTTSAAAELLAGGRCALPTLEEAAVAHRFVLGGLKSSFDRLLAQEASACPVT